MIYIQGANINEFWAREPGMVSMNLACLQRNYVEAKEALGLVEPLPALGPFPLTDLLRMRVVCMILRSSLQWERYAEHLQWNSM